MTINSPPEKRRRARRVQLAVPGSSEKMMAKAAASNADHVFLDLEDAVAPAEKASARMKVVEALKSLDWGRKTRCVRINDLGTAWCYEDVIAVVEGAGERLDTIMLPKALRAADVIFLDTLLSQIEKKLSLKRRIGIEVLIEEVQGLENAAEIARASERTECLIFGMGDYSASHGIDYRVLLDTGSYPGDLWHYARWRIVMAARSAGIDAVDGPFANLADNRGYFEECRKALATGCVGKWALHPSQIDAAISVFTPAAEDVARVRKITAAYEQAVAKGLGAVDIGGMMADAATVRILRSTLDKADLYGL